MTRLNMTSLNISQDELEFETITTGDRFAITIFENVTRSQGLSSGRSRLERFDEQLRWGIPGSDLERQES